MERASVSVAEAVEAARADERRRLERDVHDAVQQRLLAVGLGLEVAAAAADDDALARRLTELRAGVDDALVALREVIRRPLPTELAGAGLADALRAATATSPVSVRVTARGVGRYRSELERVVYYACLESVQNALKHARATHVDVELAEADGWLRFRVRDDGRGLPAVRRVEGGGLSGMRERLRTVEGAARVRSRPGRGTTVSGRVPVPPR